MENIDDGSSNCDTDTLNQPRSFVAMCYIGKRLGVACYDELENSLVADGMDISSDEMESVLNSIKVACNPTLFLLHSQIVANKPFLDLLLADLEGNPDHYRFKVLRSASWNAESSLESICKKLKINESAGARDAGTNMNFSIQANYQRLSSVLDFDDQQMRQSLSALLSFMQVSVFHLEGGQVQVASIRALHLDEYLRIDEASMR